MTRVGDFVKTGETKSLVLMRQKSEPMLSDTIRQIMSNRSDYRNLIKCITCFMYFVCVIRFYFKRLYDLDREFPFEKAASE